MKAFFKKNWCKIVLLIIILGFSSLFLMEDELSKTEVPFFGQKISYTNDLNCSITASGGIYYQGEAAESRDVVEISDVKEFKGGEGIKARFRIDGQNVKISLASTGGLTEADGLVLSNDGEKIHIINTWGLTDTDIQTWSIYPASGFVTWTRSGNVMLLGENVAYGYGHCY